ncbi:MAG: DUF429 domain-containing protein [Nocardioides sp.]
MTGRVWGVDGCRAGWVAVLADDGPLEVRVAPTLAELVASGEPPDVLAVDVPIGLPDHGRRVADVLARRALPGKAPSVFPTLVRAAYAAPTYAAARAAQLAATGHSASAQADALRARVLDADAFVRAGPTFAVLEAHPELAFARLAGAAPVLEPKRTPAGVALRRRLLAGRDLVAPAHQPGPRVRRGRPARRVRAHADGRPAPSRRGPVAAGPARGLRRRRPGGDLGLSKAEPPFHTEARSRARRARRPTLGP